MGIPGKISKIYTFYYQPKNLITAGEAYVPVWAGKNNKPEVPGFTGDDTGDNISEKNKYYSELTGIYWVWKNTYSDIVGSCHYRRYFTTAYEPFSHRFKKVLYYPSGLWRSRYSLIYTRNVKYWKPRILSEKEINNLLVDYEIILPLRRKLRKTVKHHYDKHHNPADLKLLENILTEHFPEYLSSYESVLNDNRLFANNMFVMHWETFDKLMKWLFFILFKFEEETDLEHYKGYQERIFGFLSERLITLWIVHNNIKYKELPLIYFKKMKYASQNIW